VQIEPVDAQHFESVMAPGTAALVDNPVCRYLYPDPRPYFVNLSECLPILAERGLPQGCAHLAQRLGAAIWVPPDAQADTKAIDNLIGRSTPAEVRAELWRFMWRWTAPIGVNPAGRCR
jgi:hypothetical protein